MKSDRARTLARLRRIADGAEPEQSGHLRIGIVVPPSPFVVPLGWEFVHTAPFEGPSIIAALLKGLGHEATILDQRALPDPEALAGGPLEELDVVGIATYEDSFPYIRRAAEIAKEEKRARPVVLGGSLVSSAPELVMTHTAADFAVVGEGELTTIELMDLLGGGAHAPGAGDILGLAWRGEGGRTVVNAPRPQLEDIDAVPLQDFSAWPSLRNGGAAPEIYLSASRGCPYNCTFCYRTMPALREKSPARVRRELLHLKRWGYRFAWWNDLTFIVSNARVRRLMDEALDGIDFRWCCFTRVTGVELETLQSMRARGCDLVMYGFESITPEVLDSFRKGIGQDDIVKAIETTRRAGLKVGGLFIIGGEGETRESLQRTIAFCREFREITRVKYLSAIPGTPLYRRAVEKGIILDEAAHLHFLARERSVEDDGILHFTDIDEEELRSAYREINGMIERRPYEYGNPANTWLDEPRTFAARPVPPVRPGKEQQ